ncbi:MAG TPA: MFS transporter [Methylomirabilota bacterium]|nr:MFS transporter [Methylomirabilota bacterium]
MTPRGPGLLAGRGRSWQPHHTVWGLLVFGWIGNYMVRMAFSPLLEPVMAEFGLSHAQGGFLFSIFFYGYIAMQIPAGLLGDRFGRKRVLVTGILLVAAAALLTGLARTLAVVALARLVTGLAQGLYFANDRPIIAATTPRKWLALGQGVSFSGLGLGNALGVVAGGALGEVMPWRSVFLVLAGLPLLSATLIGCFVPEPIRERSVAAPGEAGVGAAAVFRHRDLWLLGVAGMAPIWTQWLIGTWGPALFAEVGVRQLGRSALYASLLGVAALPGLLTVGTVSDRLFRRGIGRKAVMAAAILCMALATLAMGAIVQRQGPAWLVAVIVFVTSFFVWGAWAPAYAMMAEMFPQRVMGLAYGLLNATCFLAALLAPYVTGWVKDLTGSFAGGCYLAAVLGLLAAPVAMAVRPAFRLAPAAIRPASAIR